MTSSGERELQRRDITGGSEDSMNQNADAAVNVVETLGRANHREADLFHSRRRHRRRRQRGCFLPVQSGSRGRSIRKAPLVRLVFSSGAPRPLSAVCIGVFTCVCVCECAGNVTDAVERRRGRLEKDGGRREREREARLRHIRFKAVLRARFLRVD